MELAEQSVTGLFLAEGAMPLALDHEAPPEVSLDHAVYADVRDITGQIIGLEGQKLELPIPFERIIEPISPAEVTLEENELAVSANEAVMEECAGCEVQPSPDTSMPDEIMAAKDSVLDSNPTDPSAEFVVHTEPSEGLVDSAVTAVLDPDALLDPSSAKAEEAKCENGISEGSASNSASPSDVERPKEESIRKRIPPKKDRMDPLKIDMSKPTVIPLTSSQLSLQCLECHIIFSDNKSKERHLKMNHPTEYEQCMLGDALFACYVCDRHFTCSTELMAHQRTHTEKQPFKCPICGEAFSRSSELTNHKKVHFSKHGYTCPDCNKPCKTLTLLKYHQRIHTGERPYVCPFKGCGKRFSMPKAAQKHQDAHNKGDAEGTSSTKKKRTKGPSAKKFACSQCEESFPTAKSQLHHIKSKHTQCKTMPASNSTVAAELNGNPHDTTQPAIVQPPVLRMEPIGPAPQIGPLGAEQIKRLIEKLGNVQKVNQLVILGVDPAQNAGTQQPQRLIQPLHFNFTEPTTVQPVVDQQTRDQTGGQPVHEETVSVATDQATCRESLEVGVTVEQKETTVQEERTSSESVSSSNPEEQVAAVESDMTGAQLNEVRLEFEPQLAVCHENTQTAEEQSIQVAADVNAVETAALSSLISTNDCESSQYPTVVEEHVTVSTDIMAAEETITHEESLGKQNPEDSLVQPEPQPEPQTEPQSEPQTIDDSQDQFKEQSEQLSQEEATFSKSELFQPSLDIVHHDEERSHVEQEPSTQSDIQPSTVVIGEQNGGDVKDGLPIKKLLAKKKKRSKKQVTQKHSQHSEPHEEVAKSTSPLTPTKKTNKPSKAVPKKREKAKSKKRSNLQITKKNQVHIEPKGSKEQTVQIPKTSPLKDPRDTNEVPVSTQNDGAPQMKQKNPKPKKGKAGENSSGLLKTFNVPSELKVANAPEQTPRGKTAKKKPEKQTNLVKKRKSPEAHQDETPVAKKKKQSKAPGAASPKKAKVKNGTAREPTKEVQKLAKQGEKEQKSVSPASSQDQIKQQALLLLKGHKQPQLKVHKLDAKTTGLEQPLKPKGQTKETPDQEAKAAKAKGGKQNKVLQTASQKRKKAKTMGNESKKKKKENPHFPVAPLDNGPGSELSHTKPKVPRKRKAPTKIDQEIALSPPFSRLTIGCHDCGTKFSEVSALQEHMASMHSENGLLQANVSCDVSDNPMMGPRSNELVLPNSVHSNDFEIQVSADWDVEPEMRAIGLGDEDVHRLSFPALSSSPSFPITSSFAEGEGKVQDKVNQDVRSGHLETIGEGSVEMAQAFSQVSSAASDHIRTNADEGSAEMGSDPPSSISGPQESVDIKEELPSDVNLVMVEDQSEGDLVSTQENSLSNDCQEDSTGQQEEESSPNPLNHTATPTPASQLPVEEKNSTSQNTDSQTVIKHEEEEMLVQRTENQPKTSMGRNRKGRGGRGRGKRQLGKRSAAENSNKEECQVVFQLYSLTDDREETSEGVDQQREVKSVNPAPSASQSALEESPEDQVVFELQPVATRVVEVMDAGSGSLIQKSGQQVKNGTSSAEVVEKFSTPQERKEGRLRRQGIPHPDVEGLTSTGTSTDVKIEASAPIPASHDVHPSERDLLQGVQVFLVKAEDHEPHVLQGIQDMQTTHATCLDGIPSGSSAAPQSAGKQCIFYPVKEEEGEILVEPTLGKQGVPEDRTRKPGSWAASGLEECEEVRMGCTQMEMHHSVYSSAEEGDADTEQQSTQGFLEFLSQSSDTEDADSFQSDPEAETHVMSCYHGIGINRGVQQHETSRNKSCSHSEQQKEGRNESWKPIDYFIQYFCWDTWKEIAACTGKVSQLPQPVTEKEVAQFVGIHIAMGTLKFPSMKLYWEDCTRVPLIADAMLSSRFSELASKLRLACPTGDSSQLGTSVETARQIPVPGERSKTSSQACGYQDTHSCTDVSVSKTDPLWKVQEMVNRVQEGCRSLKKQGNHGVDQYPLPFQRHPTYSLHHTVMVSVTGLVMDFNLRINDSNREEVVGKMVIRENDDNQGMIFLCKPELSTPSMLEHLLEAGVRSAGKVGGSRGQVGDEFITSDGKLKLFRCHHGFILSAATKERSRSTSLVSGFERAIKAVNLNRDLRSLYRTPCTSASPSAWPLSVLWDLIDLALVNSWLQYKEEHLHVPEPLSLMAFRLEVSKALILPSSTAQESSAPDPPAPKRPSSNASAGPSDDFDTPLPDAATRYDGLGHWPEQLAEGEEARCRFGGCERTSRVRCLKCCVFLCISRNHNCFLKFHSQGAA